MDKVTKKLLGSKKYKVKVWWNLLPSKSKVKYWYFYFQKYKVNLLIPYQPYKKWELLSFHAFFDRIKITFIFFKNFYAHFYKNLLGKVHFLKKWVDKSKSTAVLGSMKVKSKSMMQVWK